MNREEVERHRDWYHRCPRCGSRERYGSDYFWDEETGEEYEEGILCLDCGYREDWNKEWSEDRPYIRPGESGSHDKPEDYPTQP